MGKNRVIKTLGGVIGSIVAHKILLKYTKRPESVNHLETEVINYRDNAQDMANEFNWNEDDKKRIKEEALKSIKSELKEPHFNNILFPTEEISKILEESIKEILYT
jgi:hypothetical protein